MASSTIKPAVTETKVVEIEPEAIVLTLSRDEAEFVRSLVGHAHILKGDGINEAKAVYRALTTSLGGFSTYSPVELEGRTVIWSVK